MFRRAIEICAVLALLALLASLPAPAAASPPCPVEYCTDSTGKYELVVPPLSSYPILEQYADCVWQVHVDFGDGSSEDLVFDASLGLTSSHVFPTPGVTYTVEVRLTEGHHGTGAEPCFDYTRKAEVRYRTPAEEEGPSPPPWEPIEEGVVPRPIPVGPGAQAPNPSAQGPSPSAQPAPGSKAAGYWRRCGAGVRAHGVPCRKGRKVIGRAHRKLAPRKSGPVAGFSCRLTAVSVVCRRGPSRILGPPA